MARSLKDAMQQYKSDTVTFFKLDNDLDVSTVRILHEGDEFIENEDWFIAHEMEIDGRKKWVQCPETADCPVCKNGRKGVLKLFLQLYEKNDPDQVKVWERGQRNITQIEKLIKQNGDLCNREYDIERHGAFGDRRTTYEFYPLEEDGLTLEELPMEKIQLLNGKDGFILQLSIEEMTQALNGRLRLGGEQQYERRDRGDRGGRGGRDDRRSAAPSDGDAPPAREEKSSGRSSGRRGGRGNSEDVF